MLPLPLACWRHCWGFTVGGTTEVIGSGTRRQTLSTEPLERGQNFPIGRTFSNVARHASCRAGASLLSCRPCCERLFRVAAETTAMMRWEYARLELNSLPIKESDVDVLNRAGEEGWELVAITGNNLAFFKRPVPPPLRVRATAKSSAP